MSASPARDDLARVRAAFDTWRHGRRGPGRIPEQLWLQATALIEHHTVPTIARELGLNQSCLRARLAKQHPSPKRRSPTAAFVELRAIDHAALQEPKFDHMPPARRELELVLTAQIERPDGTRLTLSLPRGHRGLLDELCAAFLRA